jgi:AGZA family xanthine/uracil permease-like MFS transporter
LLTVVFTFLFVSILDATGTLIGLARLGGFLDARGDLPRADRAFLADSVGISLGALLGTSTVTAYVESATGIEEGGRTGLVAVVVSLCFLLALFLGPLIEAIPLYATAPALVLVGAFMMRGVEEIPWQRYEEAIPAFLTIALIPLTYSIAHGIAGGIISYAAVHLFSGRGRTVSGVLYVLALLLVARYIWLGAD